MSIEKTSDLFVQFESDSNESNEREFSPEESEIIESFRAHQATLLEVAGDDNDQRFSFDDYMGLPDSYRKELFDVYPEMAEHDEEENLNEYEKYAMWHLLVGSTPRKSATYFDFPEGSSVREFVAEKVAKLDKSE